MENLPGCSSKNGKMQTGSWVDPQQVEQVEDAIEKELAGKFMLSYQKGKGPKLVSVIIPDDVVPGLRKLVEMREHVGMSEANLCLRLH